MQRHPDRRDEEQQQKEAIDGHGESEVLPEQLVGSDGDGVAGEARRRIQLRVRFVFWWWSRWTSGEATCNGSTMSS